ncbi:MAG: decaprenyl-phosphate phosphoribosyltransferase [Acidimicrobiia bacterium]
MIRALVRQARPRQWVKNVLVFAAPGAAGVLDDGGALARSIVAFVAFCLVSAGTYYWNDLLDIESDRLHPTKRSRPIASGAVPVGLARVVGSTLLVAGILLGFATGHPKTVAVLAIYAALTVSYSARLKHVAVVDLVAVASGFVLRAIAGAAAADVPMSTWFVLCTTFGSLFIVTGKRYAELRELGEEAAATRATLEAYSLTYLRTVLSVSVGATLVAYCIWAFETAEGSGSDFPFYELSIVPMLTALLRYLLILEQGHGGAPEDVFAADRSLQAFGVIWLVTFGLGVYVG